jgi:TRAP-type C4-dicarboxylate transport system substrate-binding protein
MKATIATSILAAAALLAGAPAHGVTLKIATISPDGTSWMKIMRKGAAEVKTRTEGRVKIRFYPGGVMGNDKSVLRKMRIGQLHGGAITGGALGEAYKDIRLYGIPLLFRSYAEVDYVRERMDKTLLDGLKQAGFVSFGLGDGGFAYLFADKPLRRIDQLKAQKVWAPEGDPISRTIYQAFGISPIQLPLTDVLTGLQTGLVNTVATSPIAAIALQWHTRVKYITDFPLVYLFGTLVIRDKALERLSPADRDVLTEVMERSFRQINAQNRKDDEGAMRALANQGIKSVEPPPNEQTVWRARVDRMLAKLGEKGYYSPQVLAQLRGYLREYRQRHAGK